MTSPYSMPTPEPQEAYSVYSKGYYDPAKDTDIDPSAPVAGVTPRTFFLIAGVFMMAMFLMIPCWNAYVLLGDKVFCYMIGNSIPITIFCFCGALLLLYIVFVSAFFGATHPGVQNEHLIMMMACAFITSLGVFLMCVSFPLRNEVDAAYEELWSNCGYGPKTQPLFQEWEYLAKMRAGRTCGAENSVRDCAGFRSSKEADVLRFMEDKYFCSGFCVQEGDVDFTLANVTQNGGFLIHPQRSLIQTHSEVMSRVDAMMQVHESNEELSKDRQPVPGAYPPESNLLLQYPPTLFSLADYQASCDGMSARNLHNFVDDVGRQMFYEGVALLLVVIFVNILKLLGFCVGKSQSVIYKVPVSEYGAVPEYGATKTIIL